MALGFGSANTVAHAQVLLTAEDKDARRGILGMSKDLDRLNRKGSRSFAALGKAAKVGGLALAAAGGAAAVGIKKSIDAASDLNESMSKNQVIFGTSAKGVLSWSKTTAQAMGVSRNEALAATGTLGNLLTNFGLGEQQAAKFSKQLVQNAADLASFNNADPSEVLEALRAGLVGETEPLRRFGVNINQARIQQEALNLGLVKGKEELTQSGKAQAIYSLIQKDGAKASGDFARTSDGLANQQRILKAQLNDTAATLGQALLPAATKVMGALNSAVPVVVKFGKEFVGAVGPHLSAALEKIGPLLRKGIEVLPKVIEAVRPLLERMIGIFRDIARVAAETWTKIVAVIRQNEPQIRQIIENLGVIMKNIWIVLEPIIRFLFTKVLPQAIDLAIDVILLFTKTVRGVVEAFQWVASRVRTIWGAITGAVEGVRDKIAGFFDSLRELALRAVLKIVEPFSHLPGRFGKWAKDAKDSANRELAKIKARENMAQEGSKAGTSYGQAFAQSASPLIRQSMAGVTPAPGQDPQKNPARRGAGSSAGRPVVVPTNIRDDHGDRLLPAFSPRGQATDLGSYAGQTVLAPEDGWITRLTGSMGTRSQGGAGGLSLYYVGKFSGSAYYMTHLMWTAKVGAYRKGTVIGMIGPSYLTGTTPHVHVEQARGPSAIAQARGPSTRGAQGAPAIEIGTGGAATLGGTGAPAAPPKPEMASRQEKAQILSLLKWAQRNIGAAPAAVRKKVREELQKLRDTFSKGLKSAIKQEDIEGLERRARQMVERIARGIQAGNITKAVGNQRAQLKRFFAQGFIEEDDFNKANAALKRVSALYKKFMRDGIIGPGELEALKKARDQAVDILSQGNETMRQHARALSATRTIWKNIWKDMGLTDAELDRLAAAGEALEGKMGEAFDNALETFKDARQAFDQAWGELKNHLVELFDEQLTFKVRATIEFGDEALDSARLGQSVTDANQTITKALTAGHVEAKKARDEIVKDLATAREALNKAIAGGDAGEIAAARKTFDDLNKALDENTALLAKGDEAASKAWETVQRLVAAWGTYYDALKSGDQAAIQNAANSIASIESELEKLPEVYGEAWSSSAAAIVSSSGPLIESAKKTGSAMVSAWDEQWQKDIAPKRYEWLKFLDDLGAEARAEGLTWDEIWGRVSGKAAELGIDLGDSQADIQRAFFDPMSGAMAGVKGATDALTEAINILIGILGGVPGRTTAAAGGLAAIGNAAGTAAGQLAEYNRQASIAAGTPMFNVVDPETGQTYTVAGGVIRANQHGSAFAGGAEVRGPVMALIGERGREWVIPESKLPKDLKKPLIGMFRSILGGGRAQRVDPGLVKLATGGEVTSQKSLTLAARYALHRQYGGNLFTSRSAAIGAMGHSVFTPPTPRTPGSRWGPVNIYQYFTRQPDNPFAYLMNSRFAAQAAYG